MATIHERTLRAMALLVGLGCLAAPVWAQDEPRVIADGVYKGRASANSPNYEDVSFPAVDFTIRGTSLSAECISTDKFTQQMKLQGTYDSERGTVSGTASSTFHSAGYDDTGRGSFAGEFRDGRIDARGRVTWQGTGMGANFDFTVDVGEGEAPPPPERIALNATIEMNPSPPKPGDQVELWATVTGPDGKTLSGTHKIWDVGKSAYGNVDPRFTWDGKELLVKLTVVYENNEYKFTKTIPAYVEATATPAGTDTKTPAAPSSGDSSWGPAAILGAVVAGVAGVAAIIGGLIALGRRPTVPRAPRTPRPPMPRPPAPRRPPPPPARVPPKPPPRVPPPPEPPTPSDAPPAPPEAPAVATETKPPPPPQEPPPDAKPPEEPEPEEPKDEEPERPEDEAPVRGVEPDVDASDGTTAPTRAEITWGPQTQSPAELDASLGDLRERMQRIIEGRTIDGYYIMNPDLVSKAWHNTNNLWGLGSFKDWILGQTGGHCGEAAEWGATWLTQSDVQGIFGPGATYDTVMIRNGRSSLAGGLINHIANRVTLPDGRRYVVDFWEGLVTGQAGPAIIPEAEWVTRWTARCNVPSPLKSGYDPVHVVEPGDNNELLDAIRLYGREWGIRRYLDNKARDAQLMRKPHILTVAERRVRLLQTYQGDQL